MAARVDARRPLGARAARGAGDLLGGPIHDEVPPLEVPPLEAGVAACLPAIVPPTVDQQVGTGVAHIDQMRPRQQVSVGQGAMDRGKRFRILGRGRRGGHVRDEVRARLLAGLGQMDLVAAPDRVPFPAEARFRIVGRGDQLCRRRDLLGRALAHRPLAHDELLDPDLPKDAHRRDLAQPSRGGWGVHGTEQPQAIVPDPRCQRLPLALASRQAVAVEPGGILVDPRRVCLRAQPLGCHQGERVEGMAQGFSHTLQAIE